MCETVIASFDITILQCFKDKIEYMGKYLSNPHDHYTINHRR